MTSNNILRIIGLNICGLNGRHKYVVFETYIRETDFICLTETKCDSIDQEIDGFTAFTKPRTNWRLGGIHGICTLVKTEKTPFVRQLEDMNTETILWLKFSPEVNGPSFILGNVYVPCENSGHFKPELMNDILNDIVEIRGNYNLPIVLIGDLNARTGTLNDHIDEEDEPEISLTMNRRTYNNPEKIQLRPDS